MANQPLVLFDLDGTLIDTAPDLAYALNLQRQKHGLAILPEETIRPYASHGSKGLLKVGFSLTQDDPRFSDFTKEYLDLYGQVFHRNPRLFDGMGDLLLALDHASIPWGVVTNKHRKFSQPLITALGLSNRIACLVCGDDVKNPKPATDSLMKACNDVGSQPSAAWYVGDAERDIQAGRAANMKTVIALYGYLSVNDAPDQWQADFMIEHPEQLLQLL